MSSPPQASTGPESPPAESSHGTDIELSQAPYMAFSGFAMGSADVVPGVSGGTMAVALGIYARLLAAITSIDVPAVRALLRLDVTTVLARVHFRFLISLAVGVAMGIGVMVKVVKLPELIQSSPQHVYAIFMGLVLASALMLGRQIGEWPPVRVAALIGGAALGLLVVTAVPVDTPESPLFIFFCGLIAICAMVLPGISGSFVLLILRKYAYVLGALSALDFAVIVPFALGCLVGITSFARVITWAFEHAEKAVTAGLVGLLIGSLWRIWPYQELTVVMVRDKPRTIGAEPFIPQSLDVSVWGLFLVGIAMVVGLEVIARRRGHSLASDE